MIERVLAKVADKDIVVTVIIEIADAHSLPPTRSSEPRFSGHVGKSPIAVVVIQMVCRCLARRHPIKPGTVDEDDIFPAIIVVIDEARPAPGSFKQVPVAMLVAINGLGCQTGFFRYVNETKSEIAGPAIPPNNPSDNQPDAQPQD